MTTRVSEQLSQQQRSLQEEVDSQQKKVNLLAQNQQKTKKLTDELASKYPLVAKLIEATEDQSSASSLSVDQLSPNRQEIEKVSQQGQALIAQLESVLKQVNAAHLIRALEKDLIGSYQEQNRQYSQLKQQVDKIESEIAETKRNRLILAEQLEKLKKLKNQG